MDLGNAITARSDAPAAYAGLRVDKVPTRSPGGSPYAPAQERAEAVGDTVRLSAEARAALNTEPTPGQKVAQVAREAAVASLRTNVYTPSGRDASGLAPGHASSRPTHAKDTRDAHEIEETAEVGDADDVERADRVQEPRELEGADEIDTTHEVSGADARAGADALSGADDADALDEADAREGSDGDIEPTDEERADADRLASRDLEVRTHEQAHAARGGQFAGAPQYEFETGPDGKRYAVEGKVSIDVAPIQGDPAATVRKMETVRAAASAPASPSSQDRAIAARASQRAAEAQAEIATERTEAAASGSVGDPSPPVEAATDAPPPAEPGDAMPAASPVRPAAGDDEHPGARRGALPTASGIAEVAAQAGALPSSSEAGANLGRTRAGVKAYRAQAQ